MHRISETSENIQIPPFVHLSIYPHLNDYARMTISKFWPQKGPIFLDLQKPWLHSLFLETLKWRIIFLGLDKSN